MSHKDRTVCEAHRRESFLRTFRHHVSLFARLYSNFRSELILRSHPASYVKRAVYRHTELKEFKSFSPILLPFVDKKSTLTPFLDPCVATFQDRRPVSCRCRAFLVYHERIRVVSQEPLRGFKWTPLGAPPCSMVTPEVPTPNKATRKSRIDRSLPPTTPTGSDPKTTRSANSCIFRQPRHSSAISLGETFN